MIRKLFNRARTWYRPVVYITSEDKEMGGKIAEMIGEYGCKALSPDHFIPADEGISYDDPLEMRQSAIRVSDVVAVYWPSAQVLTTEGMWGIQRGAKTSRLLWEIGYARAFDKKIMIIVDDKNFVPDEVKQLADCVAEMADRPTFGSTVGAWALDRFYDRRSTVIGWAIVGLFMAWFWV